ncbi:TSUP family transporter [Rubrobacter marinus]|uniref:Probable membrane transporter protein n=1 Tax=Rubrobacter marinus TaxID=2653852 RepID=A0A6G8PWR7_9ACTN|nr:sulfite exporter TauE/SafE family protein [Rubrobacter marinus]QIN78625.1 TSUP family transporter [Rubrobacter marinus]
MIDATPALFGLLVGFLVGLTGVGGGSLMTPFLVITMGVPAPTAVGTDLVYATVTKVVGSVQHYRQRSVNLQVAVFLGLGSLPASLLGVGTLEWIKASYDEESVRSIMITIIAATLVLVGSSLIYRTFFMRERPASASDKPTWDGKSPMSLKRRLFTVLFGTMGGYLVGLTSIGSGSIMAIILLLLYPLAPAVVVGTDIAHATVLSLVTGLAHASQGNVDWGLAGTLLLGSVPGVLVGSRLAPYLPGKPLRVILACMLIFVGARLLLT